MSNKLEFKDWVKKLSEEEVKKILKMDDNDVLTFIYEHKFNVDECSKISEYLKHSYDKELQVYFKNTWVGLGTQSGRFNSKYPNKVNIPREIPPKLI